jgi:glycosyltransferase involved in cell wall biosynthesis
MNIAPAMAGGTARVDALTDAAINRSVQIVCGAGLVSGKEIVCLLLARGLRDAGWNPEFMTSRWSDGEFVRRLERDGFKFDLLRLGFISASPRLKPALMTVDQLRYWPALAYGYLRRVAATSPRAIVHTNWHHALLLLPFLTPHRDIFWVHDIFPNRPHYTRVLRLIGRRVGRIVCVSHAVADSVLALGIPESRVVVIHNGVPLADAMHYPDGEQTLRLGIVGQVAPWKGHEDLIDALALLADDGPCVRLRIFGVGDPAYVASLQRRLADRGLGKMVEWCGFVNNQADIYRAIDVCVVPSRFEEPLSTSALEAGAFGRPVICSSRGGLREIIEDGVTGLVVEAERPEQLARAISLLARQPDLVRKMAESARKRVRSEFSIARFVECFVQLFDQLEQRA